MPQGLKLQTQSEGEGLGSLAEESLLEAQEDNRDVMEVQGVWGCGCGGQGWWSRRAKVDGGGRGVAWVGALHTPELGDGRSTAPDVVRYSHACILLLLVVVVLEVVMAWVFSPLELAKLYRSRTSQVSLPTPTAPPLLPPGPPAHGWPPHQRTRSALLLPLLPTGLPR